MGMLPDSALLQFAPMTGWYFTGQIKVLLLWMWIVDGALVSWATFSIGSRSIRAGFLALCSMANFES